MAHESPSGGDPAALASSTIPPVVRWAPVLAALAAVVLGVAALTSYRTTALEGAASSPLPLPTEPLSAVLLVLAGLALLATGTAPEPVRLAFASSAVVLAGLVVAEYVFRIDLGIDTLLFPRVVLRTARLFPGRPAPLTAVAILLTGLSLLPPPREPGRSPPRWQTAFLAAALILSATALAGHFLGVGELYAFTPRTATTLPAALGLLALAVGAGAATHRDGVLLLLSGRSAEAVLLRHLLPGAVLLPVLFAAGSLWGLRLGLYQTHIGLVLYVATVAGIGVAVVSRVGRAVRRTEAAQAVEVPAGPGPDPAAGMVEAVLQQGERRVRQLLEVLDQAQVAARGVDGRIRYWSAGAERLYGWSAADAVGKVEHELLRTEFPVLPREIEAALLEEGEWHGELTHRARDGTAVQVVSHWILHRDDSGRPDAVIEVSNDVTERKRAEEALRLSEARYRVLALASTALAASPALEQSLATVAGLLVPAHADWCVVSLLDEDGRAQPVACEAANPAAAPALRASCERILSGPDADHPAARALRSGRSELVAAVSAFGWEADAFGELRPGSMLWVPLRSRGSVGGLLTLACDDPGRYAADDLEFAEELGRRVAAAVDNTRLALAEHERALALAGSEARYRALVEAAAQIVWSASPEGLQLGDPGPWEAFTGQRPSESVGRGWLRAVHPDDRVATARAWIEAVASRRAFDLEHRLRRHDGEYRRMHVRAVPVFEQDGVIREWVGTHTDITDRVRAEEDLRQAQKLQAVGTLAGGVAHEVNNQLTAVLAFGDFVLQALGPNHAQAADVREMVNAALRAARVTQQVLTFSRRQVSQPCPLDLHTAASALIPVLERLLGADKTLVLLPNAARHSVLADPTQVDQILINLTANARDATATGGRVTIGIEDVRLDSSYAGTHGGIELAPGPYVRVNVSDTGRGMDKATLAHVFEPFFTTKAVGQGTGLGLSTVYGIVKQHGGFVWAYSEPGLGTTMKVYLPAAPAEAEAAPVTDRGATRPPLAARRATVLLVEDEPMVRSLALRALESAGYSVVEAVDGREALRLITAGEVAPELVLTDIVMPGLNGRELGEALSARWPGFPILYMSGYSDDDVLLRGLLPRDARFVQKPFTPGELAERVDALLRETAAP